MQIAKYGAVGQIMLRARPGLLVIFVVLPLGCSPYIYKDDIAQFSATINVVVSSEGTGKAQLQADAQTDQVAAYTSGRTPLALGCNIFATPAGPSGQTPPCTIVASNPGTAPRPTDIQQNLTIAVTDITKAEPVFAALKRYSDALVAVTNAGDHTAFQTANAALNGSIAAADTALATLGQSASLAASEMSAAGNLLADVAGLYFETRRYDALKDAVTRFDVLMPKFGLVFQVTLDRIRLARLTNLQEAITVSASRLAAGNTAKLSASQYSQEYAALQANLDLLNQLNALDTKAMINAMVSAHRALAETLVSDKGDSVPFATQLATFSADAQQLQSAFATASTSVSPAAAKK